MEEPTPTLPRLPDEIWDKILRINHDAEKAYKDHLCNERSTYGILALSARDEVRQLALRMASVPGGGRWPALRADLNNYAHDIKARFYLGATTQLDVQIIDRRYIKMTEQPFYKYRPTGLSNWHDLDGNHRAMINYMRKYMHIDTEYRGRRVSRLPTPSSVGMMRICLKEEI